MVTNSILCYIQDQKNSDPTILSFSKFVIELLESVPMSIIILCETENDLVKLKSTLPKKKLIIMNLYSLVNEIKKTYQTEISYDINYLFQIEPDKFNNYDNPRDLVNNVSFVINDILTKNKVCCVHFGVFGGAFNSMGAIILQDQLDQKSIPLYMIHGAFCKGRWRIYNSIFFEDRKMAKYYYFLNKRKLAIKTKKKIDGYIKAHQNFKHNIDSKIFEKKRVHSNKKFGYKHFIFKFIILPIWKVIYGSNDNDKRDIDRNYILFLLNKPNHWLSKYANPELIYRHKIINTIYSNLPTGYDLVLKTHPHEQINYQLEKSVISLQNCFISYKIISPDLFNNAHAIIFSGTTSAIDALMYKKHMIELGERSIYFAFENPPAKRVENISNIGLVFNECIEEEIPVKKIYNYLESILQNSYSYNNDDDISMNMNDDTYKKMARVFADQITEDGVLST